MARSNATDSGDGRDENSVSDNTITVRNENRFTVEVEISQDEAIVFLPFESKTIDAKHKSKISLHKGLKEF